MNSEVILFIKDYWIRILLTVLIPYLLGSISFSIIVTSKVAEKQDIRSMGSGNAGFTNVLRSVGKMPAILTMIGDFSKGIVAVLFGKMMFFNVYTASCNDFVIMQYGAYLAGVCCLLGHIYPCFFNFKGGKGVLSTAAVILVIDWRVLCIVLGLFLIVLYFTKIVSLGSICAAVSYPISTFLITFFVDYRPNINTQSGVPITYVTVSTIVTFVMGMFVVYKHRSNIRRLMDGTEKRIQPKRK